MEKITYLAPNLMDWVAQIKAGAANVKVHFTGGALTSYGVTPAEYTTANPFIQKVIENSIYYREGRIQIGRRVGIPDTEKPKAKPGKPSAPTPTPADKPADASKTEAPILKPTAIGEGATDNENEGTEEAAKNRTIVEVTCLQDAQGYLQEHFGISSYKVRSYVTAQKAAEEHGVLFVGAGFVGEAVKEEETATD